MPSLKFLLCNMCANFTEETMFDLVQTVVAQRPSTMGDIALAITEEDRTLDIASAQSLAEAAVEALVQSGHILVQDGCICPAGSILG